jgi:hypothetical protein
MGRDSSVGIAKRYGLDGTGSNSGGVEIFPPPSRPALGPTQPPTQWITVKRPGVALTTHPI